MIGFVIPIFNAVVNENQIKIISREPRQSWFLFFNW